MKVQLVGQALQVFNGREEPGPDWDQLWPETWYTLDLVRSGRIAPFDQTGGGGNGLLYAQDKNGQRRVSPGGRCACLIGAMASADEVHYHIILTMKKP
jgi:hypothetical protein